MKPDIKKIYLKSFIKWHFSVVVNRPFQSYNKSIEKSCGSHRSTKIPSVRTSGRFIYE